MSWKRRWTIVGILFAVQLGIVLCYQGFLSGSSPTTTPEKAKPETPSVQTAAALPVQPAQASETGEPVKPAEVATPPSPSPDLIPAPSIRPLASDSGNPVEAVKPMEPNARESETPLTGGAHRNVAWPSPSATTAPDPGALPAPVIPPAPGRPEGVPPFIGTRQPIITETPITTPQTTEVPPLPPPLDSKPHCPWTLRIEIVDGKTLLTAQSGKEVQFRVQCEKLDLQTPTGCLDASGSVKLTSEGVEGTCDRLTITWQEDHVVLEGKAHLKCHRDGQNVELKAARLSLRLSGAKTVQRGGNTIIPVVETRDSAEPPLSITDPAGNRRREGTPARVPANTPPIKPMPLDLRNGIIY